MQVLVVRHVPFEHLGLIAPSLEAARLDRVYLDVYRDANPPSSLDAYAGLISMGGPMSANDNFDYIARELRLIEEALSRGKPVLGVCLGSQLIAKAAGARVYRNAVKEIGWAPVYWKEAARQDSLFAGLDQPETVFHWHGETFDLPAGAEWLATSDRCRNQAFRLGQNAYGIQFHLEVTPAMIADWLIQEVNSGDVAELDQTMDSNLNSRRLQELSGTVFGRWAALVQPATANR